MKRAAIYCRISKSTTKADKVDDQESVCRKIAERSGYEVVEVYVDDGISASQFADRPGWNDMLLAITENKIDVLLATAEDRFTRQVMEKDILATACVGSGVTWHTAFDGHVDPATAEGAYSSATRAAQARMETQRKSERQRQANDASRLRGEPLRGRRRFYGYNDDNATAHPVEGPLVTLAYEEFLAGKTLSSVAGRMNRDEHFTTSGARWTITKVEHLLRRAMNAGLVFHRGEILPEVMGQWESLVDVESYKEAMARLNDPARRLGRAREPKRLLSSIARCGSCGQPMRSSKDARGAGTYRCSVHMGRGHKDESVKHVSGTCEVIDGVVIGEVISALMFAPSDSLPEPEVKELRTLHSKVSKINEKVSRLLDLYEDEGITKSELLARRSKYASEKSALEERIAAIGARNARAALVVSATEQVVGRGRGKSFEDMAATKSGLRQRFEALPLDQKRALIRGLVDVEVMPGRDAKRVKVTHLVATGLNFYGFPQ